MSAPDEEWRDIPGWEGRYRVSDQGRVYSVKQFGVSRSGRLLRTNASRSGHLSVSLRRDPVRWQAKVHHLVMLAFVGPLPDGMETRHLDGDPTNNALSNLRYGTRAENTNDRALHRGQSLGLDLPACRRGHAYTPENTFYVSTRPWSRQCRQCLEIRMAKKKSAAAPLPHAKEAS